MKNIKYIIVDHQMNVDLWDSKKSLFKAFYGSFYDFIINHQGQDDLLAHNINNVEEFYQYADYYADGKENCYSMGFAFHKYFLKDMMDGSLDKQPDTCFIGYCHKNGLFTDFINFLISFFAWWRNDEGCTRMDPYNYGDNFYVSSWASLVDTSKLFYFSAETVYWWQSFRVKYALDNIPGTFLTTSPEELGELPKVRIAGYEFLGWFDSPTDEGKLVKKVGSLETVYGKLKRKDIYDYWEKEEKKIVKVYDKNWRKVDPE